MNFNLDNYRRVAASESFGSITGGMGFQLLISTGKTEVALDHPALVELSWKVGDMVRTALTAAILDANPEMHEKKAKERANILALFDDPIFVEEIPSGYWRAEDPWAAYSPWFMVTTRMGRIKIGWRKSVMEIVWSESNMKLTAEQLFPDENVTKDGQLIHAWSYEKAREYIHKIVNYF